MSIELDVQIPLTAVSSKRQGDHGSEGEWGLVERDGAPAVRDTAPSGALGTLENRLQAEGAQRIELTVKSLSSRMARLVIHGVDAMTPGIEQVLRSTRLQFDASSVKTSTAS